MANNNVIEKTNNLDKTIPVDPIGYLYTNETQAHQFIISCTRKGEKVRLTGSVTARFVTSQNTYFVVHGSIVDGNAVITLHQDCYSIPGHFDLAIFVTSGTTTTVVYAAVGTVKRTDSEEGVITGEPLPTLDELLAVVRDAQQIVSDFDDIILVQDTQPTSETNRIWVQPQADEYQVPTYEEFEDQKSAIDNATFNLAAKSQTKSGVSITADGKLATVSSPDRTICIEADFNKRYAVKKNTATTVRAGCASSSDAQIGTVFVNFVSVGANEKTEFVIQTDDTNKYIYIQLFVGSDAAEYRSIDANLYTLTVVEDTPYIIDSIKNDLSSRPRQIAVSANSIMRNIGYEIPIDWDGEGGINNLGQITNTTYLHYSDYISVIPGEYEYIVGFTNIPTVRGCNIHGYGKDKQWLGLLATEELNANKTFYIPFTVLENIAYIRISTIETVALERLVFSQEIKSKIDAWSNIIPTLLVRANQFSIVGYIQANGVYTNTDNFLCTDYIQLLSDAGEITGRLQSVRMNLAVCAFYDSSKSFIKANTGISSTESPIVDFDEIIPPGAKYVRFSTTSGFISQNPTVVQTIYQVVFKSRNDVIEYFVGYGLNDGEIYFSSLVDALYEAEKRPNDNKIIHIAAGTYDVLEELGGMEYVLSHNTTDDNTHSVQPWVTNIKIIGHGDVKLLFNIDDGTSNVNYWLFACLNVMGNVEIENIEIRSSNCRYCIHDESANNYPGTQRLYRNVRLYQNVYHVGQGGQALGSGYSDNSVVRIENCHIENGGGNYSGESYSCHANNGCSVILSNSVFKRAGSVLGGVRISQNGNVGVYAQLSNCFVSNMITFKNEWTDASVPGNTKADIINIGATVNYQYDNSTEQIKRYNTITGTEEIIAGP